jgi:hypothetical protein
MGSPGEAARSDGPLFHQIECRPGRFGPSATAHPCACIRMVPSTIPAAAMPTRIERIRMWWSSMVNDSKKAPCYR